MNWPLRLRLRATRHEIRPPFHRSGSSLFALNFAPNFPHTRASSRQHRVLHAVEVSSVERGHEAACHEAEDYMWTDVVFANAESKLEILVENLGDSQGCRL